MKTVFNVARWAVYQPKGWFLWLTLAVCVTAGCGKSGTSAPAVTPPAAADTAGAQSSVSQAPANPAPQPMQTVAVARTDDAQKQLQALNRALMGWMIRNHRHPKTFEEFASTAGFEIPAPPAGKKYTLNARGFIVLSDNTLN